MTRDDDSDVDSDDIEFDAECYCRSEQPTCVDKDGKEEIGTTRDARQTTLIVAPMYERECPLRKVGAASQKESVAVASHQEVVTSRQEVVTSRQEVVTSRQEVVTSQNVHSWLHTHDESDVRRLYPQLRSLVVEYRIS
jgi:hypothetical protein